MGAPGLPESVYEKTLDCVHCGLCLSACPTYRETGRESASPRGRIYLMRSVAEGRLSLSGLLSEEASLCLGCRACESACPSGVEYGHLLESTRAELVRQGLRSGPGERLERLGLRHVVARPALLHLLFSVLRVVQRLQLDALVAPLLPRPLAAAQALLPPVPRARERQRLPEWTPARGERRGCVALLEGCVMPELMGAANRATLRVLAANGFDVWVPRGQRCCGALHAHAGDLPAARRLGRANLRAFGERPVDAVLSNSAGCGAALRELPHWIGDEARPLSEKVRDVCEWLDGQGLRPPPLPVPLRVCYDDPCHLIHAQGVFAAPRRLLESTPGLALVEHADPGGCCGAAGTYNLNQPAMARAVLARKVASLEAAKPEAVATGNPGCLMQLRSGLRDRGLPVEVLHPMEILDRAYGGEQDEEPGVGASGP